MLAKNMGRNIASAIVLILISSSLFSILEYSTSNLEDIRSNPSFSHESVEGTTVDSPGNVGGYNSMTVDSQSNIHIAYYDETNADLKYAFFDGSVWQNTVIDESGDVGESTSIAADSQGHIHICYFDETNGAIKYAYFDGQNWNTSTVGSMSSGISSISLAVDNEDTLYVSYRDDWNIKYATYNGTAWVSNLIGDDPRSAGSYSSLAVDADGNIHVSYNGISTTPKGLKYAFYNGTDWTISSIENSGYSGYYNSIAVAENGNVFISLPVDGKITVLKYNGTDWMSLHQPPMNENIHSKVAVDSNGNPHIVYHRTPPILTSGGEPIQYAVYTGINWVSHFIGYGANDGAAVSILVDSDDEVHLVYKDNSDDLMYVKTINDYDGDNVKNLIDACIGTFGLSQYDRLGCVDSDEDGYSDGDSNWSLSDGADAFIDDSTQWNDSDGDGYGDNPNGINPDMFPQNADLWKDTDKDGVDDSIDLDIDGDGISNEEDPWPLDHTRSKDTDGDGLADYVEGFVKGELIDFESGDYDGVSVHCAEDLADFCMPDYAPWVISSNSISGEYSISQRMWASDTGYFSISFSSLNESTVTLDVYISEGGFGEVECIPIYLDNVAVDYGCVSEGFSYYDSLSINVTAGEHELKFYGTILGQGNRVDNIQLPDYIISYNEDTDDDDDGWLDQKETGYSEGSPCLSDPLDPTSTPGSDFEEYYSIELYLGICYYTAYDSDEDGIIDIEDVCPNTYGVSGAEDVHGCPIEVEGKSDTMSTNSMEIGGSIGLVLFAGFIGLFLVRRRRIRALEEEFDEDDENFHGEDFYDEVVSSFSPSNETSQLPPLHAEGQQIDGYETIEYPADSGTWYYRDEDSGEWIEWV